VLEQVDISDNSWHNTRRLEEGGQTHLPVEQALYPQHVMHQLFVI
jgi:hypothetical protein